MHQNEKRLRLAFLSGAIAFPPPMDCDEVVAPYEQEFFSAPLSLPSDSASTPTSGAVGVSGNCRYGISPALKLRLQCSPSSRRRHPSSCVRALSISKSSQSPAVPVPFTHTALVMRLSVFYPLAHFAHLVAYLYYSVDCCRYTTQIASPHPCMRRHGWIFPLL